MKVSAAILLIFFMFGQKSVFAEDKNLIAALIAVESNGDDYAIGDRNRKNKAYGCLQIRQPYVDDVNRKYGTSYKAEDCLGNRALSIWIFNRYQEIYAVEDKIGRKPKAEDFARIHNGGPNGWRKKSTKAYWAKVKKALNSESQGV